jgi:hypothetical protein
VVQLVEVLLCKPECRGFNSRWVIRIFHWFNILGRTVALGLTQPLTKISTRVICKG